jgi:preprotein translocase subunit Sec61beta
MSAAGVARAMPYTAGVVRFWEKERDKVTGVIANFLT